jgi:excisionase family DNA binding protein
MSPKAKPPVDTPIVLKRVSPDSAYLPLHVAVRYLGIGKTFLNKLIDRGYLPAYKLGDRTVLLRRADLDKLATARPIISAPRRRS